MAWTWKTASTCAFGALLMFACDGGGSRDGDSGGPPETDGGPSEVCTDGDRRCGAGGTIEECADGAFAVVASCALSCTDGECGTPAECSGTEARCRGNDLEVCDGGTFATQETCANGCSAGSCLPDGPCTDGVRRCNELVLEECEGGSFAEVETCGTACIAEACTDCAGGATRCDGDDLQSCVGGAFATTETCANGCADGACSSTTSCTEGATRCMDDDVQTCSGGTYATTETCSVACVDGACSGCTNGETRCNGTTVEMCTDGAWSTHESCAFACDAAACTSEVTCTPGASRCNGAVAEICNATGSAYLYLATCPVSCTAGLCDGTCTAGQRRCNGDALEECSSAGTSWDVVETCGAFCEPVSATCAYSGLEIATDQDLEGDVIVDGAFVLRSGATITTRTGELNIRATSITIELGAAIVSAAVNDDPRAADRGNYGSSSCSTIRRGLPGSATGTTTDVVVGPGGAGGAGGTRYTSYDSGDGGLGGGVIRLVAESFIDIEGEVRADGAAGSPTAEYYSGGGGGGAGGGILVVAPTLDVTGTLSAAGGTGGAVSYCAGSQEGSPGEDGFIKTFSDAEGAIPGATLDGQHVSGQRPPLTITSSTHPNPELVYNDGFEQAVFTWSRPFEVTGYFHTLNTTLTAVPTSATGTFAESELAAWPASALTSGNNYFHIVPINALSAPGTIQNYFRIVINTSPPDAVSSSHPSATEWSASTNPFFEWTLPHDAANYRGYYYVLDQYGDTVPDASDTWLDVTQQQILLSGVAAGVHMFHIVSVDQQGYLTRAADHVRVNIGPDPGVGTVYGRVRAMDGSDLAGATVTINRGLLRASNPDQTTLATGAYNHMGVPAGTWEIRATLDGYEPATGTVNVAADSMHAVDLTLSPSTP